MIYKYECYENELVKIEIIGCVIGRKIIEEI